MTRSEAIHRAVDSMCFDKPHSPVVDYIDDRGGNVLHQLDLCDLIVTEDSVHGFIACFAATPAADEYVKSL